MKEFYSKYGVAAGNLYSDERWSDAQVAAIQAELEQLGVKYCVGNYVDIHGVPKGKVVPLSHFTEFAAGSELYTGYALDGLGQRPNDDEIASVPDLGMIIPLPWNPEMAWIPADNTLHGKPYEVNARVVLQKVLKEAEAMGFGMNLGIECEVFVLKHAEDGSLQVPNDDDNLVKSCYDFKRFMDRYDWLDKMATAIDDLGWELYSFDHEDANSQFEFDFKYADALTMCDRFVFFRYMAKHYAAEEGLLATFMPKPFADKTGSGAHFNMSLFDKETGVNLFKCSKEEDPRGLGLSKLGYQFSAGILKHGPALCAAFAPTVNSYKRLVRRGLMSYYSWAPVFNSYGSNNRTNSLRVPMVGGRVESRNADASCNPYLAAALALAAGLQGIKEQLDPGDPQEENLYELSPAQLAERGISELPRSLDEAVQAFAADPFIEEVLGSELRNEFITYKSEEWRQYHQRISQWEIDEYARLF
ncbi:type III glutamate--ammonia ligase [Coraliomargarita akajimensis]|uniref:Glutamine synthetase, type III n=1 Tax=Coraliomargarita akajimensis (strain DSM 45221 / IAM 15411 / JCM 23193 / KCTC 12865 / 04OKA010-24) TaxID=583355 RepID=D5ELF4_CORAD|nr:type III glutamate--ammonia ligase [Coraliomargarita akajimensis]ADE55090.1 glutamine synthetase, type III [Coraliomargarita akajimensis DSM 45221]